MTTTGVFCELTGFPGSPDLQTHNVEGYLPIWALGVAVIVDTIRRTEEQVWSARLRLPSITLYQRLESFCRSNKYEGTYTIRTSLLMMETEEAETERVTTTMTMTPPPTTTTTTTTTQQSKSKKKRNRRKTKNTKNEADDTHPAPQTAKKKTPQKTKTKSNDTDKRSSSSSSSFPPPREIDQLASDFLDYLHQKSHPLIDTRESLARAFQSFLQEKPLSISSTSSSSSLLSTKNRRLEVLVVTRMRQRKWMKSSKRSGDTVVVIVVEPDRKTFPTLVERKNARELLLEQQKLAEEDKEGVLVKIWKEGQLVVQPSRIHTVINQTTIIELELTAQTEVTVEEIDIRGLHSHCLEPVAPETVSVLASLPTKLTHCRLSYKIKPRNSIGIWRASIHISLEGEATFTISRSLTISCGNPDLEAILQPTSPYQPRPRNAKIFANTENQKVHWPAKQKKGKKRSSGKRGTQTKDGVSVPRLDKYTIPKETISFLMSNEMENVLNSYDWSPKTTEATKPQADDDDNQMALTTADKGYKTRLGDYGQFWSQLLYVSECQSLLDIQLFDMEQVPLERQPNSMFALTVPGLAEGRPSVLRGDVVNLTWKKQLYKGRVHSTQLLQVILEVPTKFAKAFNPSLDRVDLVRFTFSRTTLRTSHRACLELARKNLGPSVLEPTPAIVQQHRATKLKDIDLVPIPLSFANRNLNAEQEQAIVQIVHGKGGHNVPYILFGPPGTGKTTVVVETVYQLAMRRLSDTEHRPIILLTAPSNDAADILVERLASYFPPKELLRVLAYSRSIDCVPMNIRPYVNQNEENGEGQLEEIMKAKIVISTVNLAARLVYMGVPKGHFDVICVDEAGHATEPEVVAVAASLLDRKSPNSQLILAGDPKQLGPITTSKICESFGLGVSLLERLSQRLIYQRNDETNTYPDDLLTKLVRNYRSHPSILKLPNEMFYDGELECNGDLMMTHSMAKWEHLPVPDFPILFHSIQGENLREAKSPSWFNPQEAQQVVAYVDLLLRETKPPLREDEIGIITPYARQAQKIRAALELRYPRNVIKVGSVESFQGQERRVIVVSTVRSEPELYLDHDIRYNLGFIAHPKRFNVAMTRAKALLIVIGCPSVLALDKDNWLPFLTFCHEKGAMVGEAWDPLSTVELEQGEDNEAGDDIVDVQQVDESKKSTPSWELVEAEEVFGYINREE